MRISHTLCILTEAVKISVKLSNWVN